jgi:hypothetical protein
MKAKRDQFVAGYYCAVAALIAKDGADTHAKELFREGASVKDILASADPIDLDVFKEYGLLPC